MDDAGSETLRVRVGELSRADLLARLDIAGVQLNASAVTLLDDAVFDQAGRDTVRIVCRTVGSLGLCDGATLPELLAAAQLAGLSLCPPVTGPYLRLAMTDQRTAPDAVMSNGRAPTGSLTVAAAPLRDDDDYPKGFYLRVVDGVPWLRGYRCTDEHRWSPDDRWAFGAPED